MLKTAWSAFEVFQEQCKSWIESQAVIGSIASSPNYFEAKSDVDVVILVDNMDQLICQIPGLPIQDREIVSHLLKDQIIDAISTKVRINGVELSPSIYERKLFDRILLQSSKKHNWIRYYRTTPNDKMFILNSFDGSAKRGHLKPKKHSYGFLVSEPTLEWVNGLPYFGFLPDALLSDIRIFDDKNKFLTHCIERLWINTLRLAINYCREKRVNLDEAILLSKYKASRLSSECVNVIKENIRKYSQTISELRGGGY